MTYQVKKLFVAKTSVTVFVRVIHDDTLLVRRQFFALTVCQPQCTIINLTQWDASLRLILTHLSLIHI